MNSTLLWGYSLKGCNLLFDPCAFTWWASGFRPLELGDRQEKGKVFLAFIAFEIIVGHDWPPLIIEHQNLIIYFLLVLSTDMGKSLMDHDDVTEKICHMLRMWPEISDLPAEVIGPRLECQISKSKWQIKSKWLNAQMIPWKFTIKGSGLLLPSTGTASLFVESGILSGKLFSAWKTKVCFIWELRTQIPLAIYHRAKNEVFQFLNVKPITFFRFWSLTFIWHLSFGIWH